MSTVKRNSDILKTPRIKKMLQEPVGTPVELTREEALALMRHGAGRRSDFPSGVEFVRRYRTRIYR